MSNRVGWSREELLIAFYLYCQIPFGKMHGRNPDVVRYAKLIGRTPSALAMKLTNIASLDPAITATGRTGLRGASSADRAMWSEMQWDWNRFARETEQAALRLKGTLPAVRGPATAFPEQEADYAGRDRVVAAKARVRRSFFRNAVLSAYDYRCCISGLSVPGLLVASHIVPWRSDVKNRLNPRNGLCLSALHDKAFDLGLIGVTDDLRVKVSPALARFDDGFAADALLRYSGQPLRLPERFRPSGEFLAFHRERIFVDSR